MKIVFNAPVILLFSLICFTLLVLGNTGTDVINYVAAPPQVDFTSPRDLLSLITHVFGHANYQHFIGNLTFILLLGPIVEEKYGSANTIFMILVTAIVTGLLNALFFETGLIGASGIVFMLILLVSVTNVKKGEIPITFILVALLFIGKEVWQSMKADQVSQFAHIIGGICGSFLGFSLRK